MFSPPNHILHLTFFGDSDTFFNIRKNIFLQTQLVDKEPIFAGTIRHTHTNSTIPYFTPFIFFWFCWTITE